MCVRGPWDTAVTLPVRLRPRVRRLRCPTGPRPERLLPRLPVPALWLPVPALWLRLRVAGLRLRLRVAGLRGGGGAEGGVRLGRRSLWWRGRSDGLPAAVGVE
ncbi:hypothetical protein, partial [Streptomyces alkaliterrae]|uniref:hypothetical protein n=1 Tax=Streptomyces alkaliterrae TaxID=2213162 RepID=UPI001E60C86C